MMNVAGVMGGSVVLIKVTQYCFHDDNKPTAAISRSSSSSSLQVSTNRLLLGIFWFHPDPV